MRKKLLFLLFLLLIIPNVTFAKSNYIYSGDNFTLDKDINNSYMVLGDDIIVNNRVDGIYLILGQDIKYNAINDYMMMFAQNVTVTGTIKDGVIAAQNIVIDGGTINRDIVMAGEKIKLKGIFNGNVVLAASSIDISESIFLGDVYTASDKLTIDKDTKINGSLKYGTDTDTNIMTKEIGNVGTYDNNNADISKDSGVTILHYVYKLVGLLVIFLAMYLIIPQIFDKFSNKVGKNFGYGAIAFFCVPLALLILLFTVFASKTAIIGILLYVVFIMISKVISGYVLGELVWTKLIKKPKRKYLVGIMGITILYLITLIPFIGGWVTLASLLYSFGIITNLIFKNRKK